MLSFLDSLITILTIAITVIPLFKDVMLKKEKYLSYGFFRRITSSGWVVIWLAIILLDAVLYKDFYYEQDKQTSENKLRTDISDTVNIALSKHDLKYENGMIKSTKDTVVITPSNSIEHEKNARLALAVIPNVDNPSLTTLPDKSTLKFTVYLSNYGDDFADNISDRVIIVAYKNNTPIFKNEDLTSQINKSVEMQPNKTDLIEITFNLFTLNGIDFDKIPYPTYLYYRVKYTNSKNIPMKQIRKIFWIKGSNIGEVNETNYEKVEADLKKYKYY